MIAEVDCTADDNVELCNSNGAHGFPTLNMYKEGVMVNDSLNVHFYSNFAPRLWSTPAPETWPT